MEKNHGIYIFDLDGTLAQVEHRQPILDTQDPRRYEKFRDACGADSPHTRVIRLMQDLHHAGNELRIFTGRDGATRQITLEWLHLYTGYNVRYLDHILTMRPEGNKTEDADLKTQWYLRMPVEERRRVIAIFEDRNSVVERWRQLGLLCCQVALGDF